MQHILLEPIKPTVYGNIFFKLARMLTDSLDLSDLDGPRNTLLQSLCRGFIACFMSRDEICNFVPSTTEEDILGEFTRVLSV